MDDLSKINEEFNDSLGSGFSLTKMFKKDALSSKMLNIVLATSLMAGAFKGISTTETYNNIAQDVKETISTDLYRVFGEQEEMTTSMLSGIVKDKSDGIYKVAGSDANVIIAYDGAFDNNDSDITLDFGNIFIEKERRSLDHSPYSSQNHRVNQHPYTFVNMKSNYFNDYFSDSSLLVKNGDLFTLAHEYNHTTQSQIDMRNAGTKSEILYGEGMSDVFGLSVVIKESDLSIDESINMLDDLRRFRDRTTIMSEDYGHSTQMFLKSFKQSLLEPGAIEMIKSSNVEDLGNMAEMIVKPIHKDFLKVSERYSNNTDKRSLFMQYEAKEGTQKSINNEMADKISENGIKTEVSKELAEAIEMQSKLDEVRRMKNK